jgi:hypothetical protein
MTEQSEILSPEIKPSVKMSISGNGLIIKLAFNSKGAEQLMETGIRRLLEKYGIRE